MLIRKCHRIAITLLIIIGSITATANSETGAYWRFEEGSGTVLTDSSLRGNDGSLLNAVAFSMDVPVTSIPQTGQPNLFSGAFDGVDDIAVVPDSPFLRPNGGITVEAWIFPESGARVIVGKQVFGGCCVNSFQLELNPFRFQLTEASGQDHLIGPGIEPSAGKWQHVAGTWDGSTMRLFLDGVQVASGSFTGSIGYDTNPVLIGGEDDGLGIPGCCLFRGRIDEVRISDRALDPSEFLNFERCDLELALCVDELALCEENLEICEADLGEKTQELAECQEQLDQALSEINNLEQQIIALQGQINNLEAQVVELQAQVEDLQTQIAGLLEQIAILETNIASLEAQINDLEAEIAELQIIIDGVNSFLGELEADFQDVFDDPAFTIPGNTALDKFSSLVDAIVRLDRGRKMAIYRNLGGRVRN